MPDLSSPSRDSIPPLHCPLLLSIVSYIFLRLPRLLPMLHATYRLHRAATQLISVSMLLLSLQRAHMKQLPYEVYEKASGCMKAEALYLAVRR